MKLINETRFELWREKRELPEDVLFGTSDSYYGLGLRTRPGAFFMTQGEFVHWSYDPNDCHWAMFEEEKKVEIQVSEISDISVEKLGIFRRMYFLGAKWVINIRTKSETNNVVLYRDIDKFVNSVRGMGIELV